MSFVLLSTLTLAVGVAIGATLFVGFWGGTYIHILKITKLTPINYSGVLLFFILLVTLAIAITGTLTLLGAHILYRLIFHLRSEQGKGLRGWSNETKDRLVPPSVQAYASDAKTRAGQYYSGGGTTNGSVKIDVQ